MKFNAIPERKRYMTSKLFLAAVFVLAWDNYAVAEETVNAFHPVRPAVQAPATKFSDGSKLVTLAGFRGRNVILNFWATWCSPCVKEMPSLDRLSAKMGGDNLVFIAVNQDSGAPSEVKPFLDKLKVKNLTVLYDHRQTAFRDFGIRVLPTTFVISPQGKILARLEGAIEWETHTIISTINE